MRQLHPVAFHERFAASGTYIYEENGQPTGITESWTIHLLPDNSQLIRVDHDARSTSTGRTILLEALRDGTGNIQRFDLHLYNPNGTAVKQAKASYSIFDDHIQIGRQINDEPRRDEEISIPAQALVYPLMHIFTGSLIQQVIQRGGNDIPVFIPRITEPDNYQVLSGIIEKRSASLVSTRGIEQNIPVKGYQFAIGNDQPVFWLDQHHLLIAYEDRVTHVTLKNLARSSNFLE